VAVRVALEKLVRGKMNELSLGMCAAEAVEFEREMEERVRARLPHLRGEAFTAAVQTECLMVLVESLSESLDALEAKPKERRAVWHQLEVDLRLSPGTLGD
jgi:hypothetical protein